MTRIVLFSMLLLGLVSNSLVASCQEDIPVSQCIPEDTAMFVSIKEPVSVLNSLSDGLGICSKEWLKLAQQLAKTDLTDGSEKKLENPATFVSETDPLMKVKNLFFILTNSRKKIGDIAFVLEMKKNAAREVTAKSLFPTIKRSCFFARKLFVVESNIGSEVDTQLGLLESGFKVTRHKNWIIISHSRSLADKLQNGLQGKVHSKNLDSSRRFRESRTRFMKNAFVKCYIAPNFVKSLLALWEPNTTFPLNSLAWINYSLTLDIEENKTTIKQQTVYHRLRPSIGANQIWDFHEPIVDYPPIDLGEFSQLFAHNLNVAKWKRLERKRNERLLLLSKKLDHKEDVVDRFLSGAGRENLGGMVFSVETENGGEQTWYRVPPEKQKAAKKEISAYFNGLEKNYRQAGYEVETDFSTKDYWKLKINNAIAEPEYSFLSAAKGATYDDELLSENQKILWSHKYGTKYKNWFVIGTYDPIDKTIQASKPSRLKQVVEEASSYFQFRNKEPRRIVVVRSKYLYQVIRLEAKRVLTGLFGYSWRISSAAYKKIVNNESSISKLSNPQKITFLISRLIDRIEKNTCSFVRLDFHVEDDYYSCGLLTFEQKQKRDK